MKEPFCSECGKYHEVTTACPYKYQTPIISTPSSSSVMEQKVDKIIKLLEQIEYLLRTQ